MCWSIYIFWNGSIHLVTNTLTHIFLVGRTLNIYSCVFLEYNTFVSNLVFFVVGSTGVWTQFFALAREAFYQLSHAAIAFCSGYFGDSVSLFLQMGLDCNPHPAFFVLWWDLAKFFPRAGLETRSCRFQSPTYLGWQMCATLPSYWLRWHLKTFPLDLAETVIILISVSQVPVDASKYQLSVPGSNLVFSPVYI
jgi:hypothetical protein